MIAPVMSTAGVMVGAVTNLDEWILYAGGVAVALAAIGAVLRRAWRVARRFDAFFEDWFGQPARAGRDPVPGIPERVRRLELGMRQVRRQVTPNGGHSQTLGDKVARIEHQLGTENDDHPDSGSSDETGGT